MQPSQSTPRPLVPAAQAPMPSCFIGIDVAKEELVIAQRGGPPIEPSVRTLANQPQPIKAWLQTLPACSAIAMESTGRYHQTLARLACAAGFAVYVLNAKDVYFYARALGSRGKTDRLDAQVIARYIAEHHGELHTWSEPSQAQQELNALLTRRALLAKERDTIRKALEGIALPGKTKERFLSEFDACMRCIDKQVSKHVAKDAQLNQACARLRTVTGIGEQISTLLANLLGRIPFANADALVAYCGLDPRPNDSGQHKGRRRITKRGPALLRRQMWLAGFAASHSKVFSPFYRSLRARGLSTTESFLILGRKILRIAFAVWRSGKPFDASRLAPVAMSV